MRIKRKVKNLYEKLKELGISVSSFCKVFDIPIQRVYKIKQLESNRYSNEKKYDSLIKAIDYVMTPKGEAFLQICNVQHKR